ncbi:MAG: AAA family ATPase, partial [Solirubrobacterales bacterium]|nr:AAA family ATPase [Solirubrobacterales bacterium]
RADAPIALIGDAGMGKTTLLDNVAEVAAATGIRTMAIAGDPISVDFPFRALRALLTDSERADGLGATETIRALVAAERSAGPALTAQDSTQVSEMVVGALSERLGATPSLLTLRDAHWVDEASLAALEGLLAASSRILLLIECRSDATDSRHPLGRFLTQIAAIRVELGGLPIEHVRTLAEGCLGVRSISAELANSLALRAGGNPFFVQQLALMMSAHGRVARQGDVAQLLAKPSVESIETVPSTIHDALASRIDRLDPHTLIALKAASVLGLTFEAAGVHAIYPIPVGAHELAHAFDRLIADNVIEPCPGRADTFRFRHALYREVTYSLMTQPQRTAAHSAAAAWIERERDPEEAIELLAHHWTQAEVAERAVPLLSLAARRTAGIWAGLGTIELVSTAQRLAHRERLEVDPLQRGEWDLLLAQAYRGAGEMAKADSLLAHGLETMGMHLPGSRLGRICAVALEVCRQLNTRVAPARRIGRLAEQRDRLTVLVDAHRALAIAAYSNDDLLAMALVNLRILNLVESAGLRSELPVQYSMAQLAAASAGARRPALRYRQLARRAAESQAEPLAKAHSRGYDAIFLLGEGLFPAAREQLDAVERCYEDTAPGSYILDVVVTWQGYVDYFTGHFSEAIEAYRRVYRAGLERGDPAMIAWGLNGQAMCLVARGEDELVLERLDRSRDLPMERLARIAWHSFRAVASVRLDALDEAAEHAQTAGSLLFAQRATVAILQPEYSALAEVAMHLRRSPGPESRTAAEFHRRLLRQFARLQRRFQVAVPMYLVRLGDHHRLRGEHGQAWRCYERAAGAARRHGMRFDDRVHRRGHRRVPSRRPAERRHMTDARLASTGSFLTRPGDLFAPAPYR